MPGGVCAVLDYEVDQMAEYVAEMAIRVVTPQGQVRQAFKKFVSQILTSTRLPSTTILLGMNYLAKRMNMINSGPSAPTMSEGQVWRMLTVSLLLGSKFLDDNTFQNRSWAEVSGINVSELNKLENEWLAAIQWSLYVNLDCSKDYQAWLKNWKDWQENQKRQQLQTSRERLAALSPIDTDVRPRNLYVSPWAQPKVDYERVKRNEQAQESYRSRESSWQPQYPNPFSAPLTPPDSGYGTPEYANSATSVNARYNDWFSQTMAHNNYSRGYQQCNAHSSYPRNNSTNYPAFYNHYSQGNWESNLVECNCQYCLSPMNGKQSYFIPHNSFGQPVAG